MCIGAELKFKPDLNIKLSGKIRFKPGKWRYEMTEVEMKKEMFTEEELAAMSEEERKAAMKKMEEMKAKKDA